jgi:lipoprotein-releasing system permease protein
VRALTEGQVGSGVRPGDVELGACGVLRIVTVGTAVHHHQDRSGRNVDTADDDIDLGDPGQHLYGRLEPQRFFDQGDAVTGVEVKVRNIARARAIGRRIERALGGGAYHTLDWEALNHNLFTALSLQKLALSLVITIIIVIAAFNVIATLVMVVLDKKREIAILKAMGAPEGAILRIFLAQGLAVGGLGTALGISLGAATCWLLKAYHFPLDPQVYLIRYVPVRPSVAEFAFTAVVAMLIALVASLVPAVWASRLAPVDGLRHE